MLLSESIISINCCGSLILLTCLLFYILTASISEYYLYLPVWVKVSLVSFFILAGSFSLIRWVIIPLMKMVKMGRVISHEQAAEIIGRHFPEISDKLLNILQLKKQSDTASSRELIAASIGQKASLTTRQNILKINDLAAGVYLLQVNAKQGAVTQKLVKER